MSYEKLTKDVGIMNKILKGHIYYSKFVFDVSRKISRIPFLKR